MTLFPGEYTGWSMKNSSLRRLEPLAQGLVSAAEATARAARKHYREHRQTARGTVLHPGTDTPLWNELARECVLELRRFGEKAKLARLLGITRQRVHLLLVSQNACPDAERTLQLLAWLQSRRRGGNPA